MNVFTIATTGRNFRVTFSDKKRGGKPIVDTYDRNGMAVCWALILKSRPDATLVVIG